ncbi:MAG: aromatic amino acid lyase, partial [Acidobacteriota bacterium]
MASEQSAKQRTLRIDGNSLTPADVEDVARRRVEHFELDDAARAAMQGSQQRVRELIESGATVYGVNTGFGHFAGVRVAGDKLEQLQLNLVRSHAVGVGEPLPLEAVRGLMLLRANVLARGHSGARPRVA